MEHEELIRLAEKARAQGAFPSLSEEELAALPVKQKELGVPVSEGSVRVYEFRPGPENKRSLPMLINFHGGGFIKGRADRDQVYCSNMAARTGALVWDVDYALAPENPFPAAVNQCYDIIRYAFAHAKELNVDPERILLIGHSAGSNLAAAACIRASEGAASRPTEGAAFRATEGPAFRPAGMILDYMPADQMKNPLSKLSPQQRGDAKRVARAKMERQYLDFYLQPEEALSPLASPILASEEVLGTFPDCLVVSAGEDSLRDECEAFAHKLAASGVTVTLRRFRNSRHGFTINRVDEYQKALALHEQFILNHI